MFHAWDETRGALGQRRAPAGARAQIDIAAYASALAVTALVAFAAVAVERRLAGALVTPLDGPVLLASSLALVVTSSAVRTGRAMSVAATACVLAAAASLSLRGTSPAGLVALWAPIIAFGVWMHWFTAADVAHGLRRRFAARGERGKSLAGERYGGRADGEHEDPHTTIVADSPLARGSLAGDGSMVVEECTRIRLPCGSEVQTSLVRVALAAGQRTAVTHVAFCPPMERSPKVDVAQADGPPARLRVTQAFAYGARVDIKLQEAVDAPAIVELEITAATQKQNVAADDPLGENQGRRDFE